MKSAVLPVRRSPAEVRRAIEARVPRLRKEQRALGRDLAEARAVSRGDRALELGAATFAALCEQVGLSPPEGHQLADAAEACAREPSVARKIERGTLSVPAAATLGKVFRTPELMRRGDDWIGDAEKRPTREFQDLVRYRKEEERIQEKPTPRTLHFSRTGLADLERTRDLASRRRQRLVSESEAVEVALDEFVERHDPERKAARATVRRERSAAQDQRTAGIRRPVAPARRDVSTSEAAGSGAASSRSRRLPARERHAILARQGDRCAVEGCEERLCLEFAHVVPWRLGGANTARNCRLFCRAHHRHVDSGRLKIRRTRVGEILVDVRGGVVDRLRGPPAAPG